MVQNRSHYVNPSTHAQFKHLGIWIEKHREELYAILDRENELFPERFVLFGEWVFATHSIHYQNLPDLFLGEVFINSLPIKLNIRPKRLTCTTDLQSPGSIE